MPRKHVFDFNQALMDFGATVCIARKPKCEVCPMTRQCGTYPVLRTSEAANGRGGFAENAYG